MHLLAHLAVPAYFALSFLGGAIVVIIGIWYRPSALLRTSGCLLMVSNLGNFAVHAHHFATAMTFYCLSGILLVLMLGLWFYCEAKRTNPSATSTRST